MAQVYASWDSEYAHMAMETQIKTPVEAQASLGLKIPMILTQHAV